MMDDLLILPIVLCTTLIILVLADKFTKLRRVEK